MNEIILGDCLDYMRNLPDRSIDLCLTDPPYGIGEASGKNRSRGCLANFKDYGCKSWDDKIVDKKYIEEIIRISKNQIIFGLNYYIEYLKNTSCVIVWDKDNGKNDFSDCELAWASFNTAVRKINHRWHGMLQQNMKNKEKRYHPTQKPVNLFAKILKMYSEPGQTILDPFAGSGTTALACIRTGRKYICIEKDKEYFEIIKKRIKAEREQPFIDFE